MADCDAPASPDELLIKAAAQGCAAEVRSLVRQGADPCVRYGAAINEAAAKGHLDVVKLLVRNGASARVTLSQDLIEAVEGGHDEIVDFLLQHGRDPNANSGEPILAAVSRNRTSTLRILLDNGGVPDEGCCARNALWVAVLNQRPHLVELLFKRGARIGNDYKSAFQATERSGSIQILGMLVDQLLTERQKLLRLRGPRGIWKGSIQAPPWKNTRCNGCSITLRKGCPEALTPWDASHLMCVELPLVIAILAAIRLNSIQHVSQALSAQSDKARFCLVSAAILQIRCVRLDLERSAVICAAVEEVGKFFPEVTPVIKHWILSTILLLFRDDWPEKSQKIVSDAWDSVNTLGMRLGMQLPDPPVRILQYRI